MFPDVVRHREGLLVLLPVEEEDRCPLPHVGRVEEGRDARSRVHAGDNDPIGVRDHPDSYVMTDDPRGAKCERVPDSQA